MAFDDEQNTAVNVDNQTTETVDAQTVAPTPENVEAPVEQAATTPVQEEVKSTEPQTDEIAEAFGQRTTFDFKNKDGKVLRSYGFQFPGVLEGTKLAMLETSDVAEYWNQLFKQLSTDPQVRSQGLEWFNTHTGMVEVATAASQFLNNVLNGVRY